MHQRLAHDRWNPTAAKRALSISNSRALRHLPGCSDDQLEDANDPETNMVALADAADTFDSVVSDQVREHVKAHPQEAVNETFRMAKPGGLVVHPTCLVNPIHGPPRDSWRFPPEALRHLVGKRSIVVESDGWSNMGGGEYAAGVRRNGAAT